MNKILKYMAAAIFITMLAINVAITLDDPFVMLSDEAIATTSSSTSTGTPIYVDEIITEVTLKTVKEQYEGQCRERTETTTTTTCGENPGIIKCIASSKIVFSSWTIVSC